MKCTKLIPVVNPNGSDSARLDNTLEFLVMSGMDLPHAIMITIPEPWENNKVISQEKRDFYQYYATMMEPWDGPASIIFTDGDQEEQYLTVTDFVHQDIILQMMIS